MLLMERGGIITMLARTWPYGTQKQVTIIGKAAKGRYIGLVCHEAGSKEAFVCIYSASHPTAVSAREGEKGTLTFTEGGPTGGYWDYRSATVAD